MRLARAVEAAEKARREDRTRMTPRQVRLTAHWVPAADAASLEGRLVVQRKTRALDGTGSAVVELWSSGPVDELAFATSTAAELTPGVRRLLDGVNPGDAFPLTSVATLRRVTSGATVEMLRLLSPHASRVMDLTVTIPPPSDGRFFGRADVRFAEADLVAAPLRDVVRPMLAGLDREPASAETPAMVDPVAERPAPDESLEATLERIVIRDSRGLQIGQHNLQINHFTARAEPAAVDFSEILQKPTIREAIGRLHQEPGNAELRASLTNSLEQHGFFFAADPVTLPVSREASGGEFCAAYSGTVVFGVQVGNDSVQENHFVYVAPPYRSAADLLRGNHQLAVDFAEFVCPPLGKEHAVTELNTAFTRTFEQVLADPKMDWSDVKHGQKLDLPRPDAILRVDGLDGGTIGPNRQRNQHVADYRAHRVEGLESILEQRQARQRTHEQELP